MKASSLVVIAVAFLASCSQSSVGPKSFAVEYQVTGAAGPVDIVYTDGTESTSGNLNHSLSSVSLPWSYSWTAFSGALVYVMAKNTGADTVTLSIYRDGVLFMTDSYLGDTSAIVNTENANLPNGYFLLFGGSTTAW